jgi:quercetin dioxygenase-like cupin family protein
MPLTNLESIESKELIPGFHGRFVHSDNMTFAYWRIEEGASAPVHDHPHEQFVNVLEGEFELTVEDEKHILTPGKVFVLPSNMPHGGKALTPCRILDVFHPVREDLR